jgi:hypothetical protein
MKEILAELNSVINDLEKDGYTKEAKELHDVFLKIAQHNFPIEFPANRHTREKMLQKGIEHKYNNPDYEGNMFAWEKINPENTKRRLIHMNPFDEWKDAFKAHSEDPDVSGEIVEFPNMEQQNKMNQDMDDWDKNKLEWNKEKAIQQRDTWNKDQGELDKSYNERIKKHEHPYIEPDDDEWYLNGE